LDLSHGKDLELINGVMVERMSAQLQHEKLFVWLLIVLTGVVRKLNLGIVLGSRTTVEISEFGGRLPDVLFVRRDRMDIVHERAIYGAPDLVIEISSPNDRPSDFSSQEADYRSLGVGEIVFIDMQRRQIRILLREENGYSDKTCSQGIFTLTS